MTDLTVDLDDLDIQADDTDDDYVRIRKSHLNGVRDAAKAAAKHRKEADDLRREKAVTESGLKDLTAAQRQALADLVKEPTADALKAKAIELGFVPPEPAAPAPSDEELAEHEKAAQVANGASAPASSQVTPEEANGWPTDRLMRLSRSHPDLYESLLRGETVSLPQGFA